jgi:hypothetical protein
MSHHEMAIAHRIALRLRCGLDDATGLLEEADGILVGDPSVGADQGTEPIEGLVRIGDATQPVVGHGGDGEVNRSRLAAGVRA